MKKFEISAYSIEEAKEKALEMGITVMSNVTKSWRNANCPMNDKDLRLFAMEMMDKHRYTTLEGVGLMIVIDAGSKDTRKRPHKFENNIVEGKRSTKRIFEIRLKSNDQLIGEAETKSDAIELAKDLMTEYREDMYSTIVYRVLENKDIAFTLKYEPSISAKLGKYVVFGNEKSF